MKKCLTFVIPALIGVAVLLPLVAGAEINLGNQYVENIGTTIGATTPLPQAIGRIINIILSVLGLIATVLIILAGFQWMTSAGNEEKIAAAKKLMMAAIIGLIIVLLAYAISAFVMGKLAGVA